MLPDVRCAKIFCFDMKNDNTMFRISSAILQHAVLGKVVKFRMIRPSENAVVGRTRTVHEELE